MAAETMRTIASAMPVTVALVEKRGVDFMDGSDGAFSDEPSSPLFIASAFLIKKREGFTRRRSCTP